GATLNDPEVGTVTNPIPGVYTYRVISYNNPNPSEAYTITSTRCVRTATAVGELKPALQLSQNQPNPFSRSSLIRFSLPKPGPVQLGIYDVAGRKVRALVDGAMGAGQYQRMWDGRNDAGSLVSSGVYFYRLETPDAIRSRQMMLLR